MENNAFLKSPSEYIRDHDIIGNYKRIVVSHLVSKYRKSHKSVTDFVERKMADKFKPKDPTIHVLRKDKNKDRYKAKTTLNTFLGWVDKNNLVLGPNLVVYQNYKVEKSLLAEFVLGNLAKRSKTKKLMAEYFANKQKSLGSQMNLLQSNFKLFNNSISGATSSPFNSLYCASSHTTLTSICRSCTSFANASNEKLIASNRAYFTLDDALANIADIASRTDLVELDRVMKKYSLSHATVEETVNVIMDSIKLYNLTKLDEIENSITDVITGLSNLERTAVCHTGDLNAFKKSNETFLRKFLNKFLFKPTVPVSNPDEILAAAFEDVTILASLLNASYTRGTSVKKIKDSDPALYGLYAAHVKSISDHLDEHKDFIHAYLSCHTVPHNLHSVPHMNRMAVVGSDTDSSIFSVQTLTEWFEGHTDFTEQSDAISAVFAFISTQVVGNAMLMLSRQMGVREDQFYRISMKSEYYMPVLSLSNAQKHYMYLMGAKEASVYAKDKLDVRGVGYKNSRVPREIMDLTNNWYYELMMSVRNNRKLIPEEIMSVPAFIEHTIIDSIKQGSTDLCLHAKVKGKDSYAKPMSSIYAMFDFWNETFGAKYGQVTEVPASGVKVNVTLANKKAIETWCENIGDKGIADSIIRWCKLNNRWSFSSLFIPGHMAATGKMPKEIIPIADIEKVLSDMTSQFYLFMTTFGIYMTATEGDRVHDIMTMEDAKKHELVKLELG